jgi:hypothetical protein
MHTPDATIAAKRQAEERKAERAAYRTYDGAKGDTAYVIDGPFRGASGKVIWIGVSRGEARVGVKVGPGREDVVWCAACDVSADKPAPVGSEMSIIAEVAVFALVRIVALGYRTIGVTDSSGMVFAAPAPKRARKRRAVQATATR